MKTIIVPFLALSEPHAGMNEISNALDKLGPGYAIDVVNWAGYDSRPVVKFNIAYGSSDIYIKYYVTEPYTKAEHTQSNDEVYEDSCVEFFVAPDPDGIYYNFEFNAIGTCLMAMGPDRNNRQRMDPEIIAKIKRFSSLGDQPFAEKKSGPSWELTVAIPLEVFIGMNIKDLKGKTFRANFYKCGDKLSRPHYLSWNPIGTKKPDFHRPDYFGTLKFE
jgi:hypothetical protein